MTTCHLGVFGDAPDQLAAASHANLRSELCALADMSVLFYSAASVSWLLASDAPCGSMGT